MKIASFFKILNRKIDKYDKLTSNPFSVCRPITLVWIEDGKCRGCECCGEFSIPADKDDKKD